MSFIKRTLLYLFILIVLLLIGGSFLPTQYTVMRSIEVSATPEKIHSYVGDLKRWPEWEPWTEGDPTMTITLGEKTQGIGATQSWRGESGNGRLIFTKDSETTGIAYDLSFEQGRYRSSAELKYRSLDKSQTRLEWTMSGNVETPLIGGYFALLIKSFTGPLFEKGLEQLKAKVES